MSAVTYDPRLVEGVELFNACDFFEAHEVWEHLWQEYQGPSRKFYQGLIQTAVALHHFGNGNLGGAKKLFHSSRNYLQPYGPLHEGVNITKLLAEMETCFADVLVATDLRAPLEINPDLIPEIHLDPPPAAH